MKHKIAIKWIYAAKEELDGTRVLVDSVLPHGRDLHDLDVDIWSPKAAPSSSLKRQLIKNELDLKTFASQYRSNLRQQPEKILYLVEVATQGNLTLLTAEREPEQTWLTLLKDSLEVHIKNTTPSRNY